MQDVLRGQGINATRVNGGAARRMAV